MKSTGKTGTHVDRTMDYRLPVWFIGVLMDNLFERRFGPVQKYNENFKMQAEIAQGRKQTV